ncbi:hypothetical protein LAZ67_1006784, partial [Cordylochernes scorpioides]
MADGMSNLVPKDGPGSADQVPERPSNLSQAGEKLAPKNGNLKNFNENSSESENYANSPAGDMYANPAAARGDVTAPPTAALNSATTASPASLNWADSEMAEVDANEGFTVVKSKKRRRTSTTPEHAAKQRSRPAEKPSSQQLKRPSGPRTVPPKEIKATRANIAEAKARQNSSTHENYIFVERCPEIPDYTYLKAMSKLVGGPNNITHFGKMNGYFLVGLATKDLARRLVEGDLEIEGTTLRVFPYRKRAERIVVANLPGFVEDFTVVNALSPYGRVTSIAPILVKMGEFTFTDGRREAFILLNDGIKLDRLPTRLEIQSKGDTLQAFLSFGIKCSKCGKQGHRRANCPALARQAASPTDARPPPSSSSSSAAKEAGTGARNTGVPCPTGKEINRVSGDPLGAPSCRTDGSRPARPCHPPCFPGCPAAPRASHLSARPRDETNAFHLGSGQDLCLGYSAVILAHPVAISGSGLACVFGPGVAVLRQSILWPGHIALATIDVHGEEMTAIAVHLAHEPRERNRQLELLAATAAQEEEGPCWIIGDFNIRDRGPSSSSSSDALAALLDLAALVDVATQFDAAHLPTRAAMHGDQVESNRLDRILVPAGVLDRVSIYATSHYHLSDHRLVLLQVGPPTTAVSSPTQPRLAAMLRSGLVLEHLAGYIRELEEDAAHDDDDGTFWDRWTSIKAGLLAEARSLHDPRHAASDSYVYRARRYIAAQLEASSIRTDYPSLPDLARAIRLRRPVSVIRDDDDNVIEGPELRRRAFATFWPRFARPTTDPAAGAAFIASSAPTTTCELSEEDPLHRPDISPSEIANAIEHLPRGKAPGWDGLPFELLVAFNEDFFAEALARGPGRHLFHRRLKPHLRTLVPECQTYAVPGRSPSWNIAKVKDAVEEATAMGSPLAVMGVDLESAFDSLDRGFLESLMTSLHLPPAFMGWINILYAGADATIRAGGFHTTAFPLLNGLRQGCAVSAALFSIATGPLLRRLELTLGVGNVIAYADDIVLLFHRDEEFERVATVLEDFKRASGIAVNLGKSAGLCCGAWRKRGDSPLGASWSTTSIRVLGLDIAPRSSVAHQEQHLLALLESACRRWTPFTRGLSLVGRARAANSLVGSTIQHHLHGYLPSPPTIAKLQARLARFVWGPEHTAWLPAAVMARPVAIGGLGLLDLATQLQLACFKGVQVALRGGRNGFVWLVASGSEAWIRPPPDGTRLQPRRLRLLKLWEEASKILSLNHRAVPASLLLDIPIIGGCRFLRPPDLLAPARWRGARVRDLLAEGHLTARPTRSALADAAALGAFCRRLTSENAVGFRAESAPSSSSLAAAVVLRGTATPFLNGLTTRSARRALDRPRLAATPISRFTSRWSPTIGPPPSRIDWASLRRCAHSGHEADAALKLALHALPNPAHPASVGPSCPACGSIDRSLGHRYWCCRSIRPLIRETFNIIGRPPDLQAWIFGGSGLEDDALSILASAKLRIYRYFVQALKMQIWPPRAVTSRPARQQPRHPMALPVFWETGRTAPRTKALERTTTSPSSRIRKGAATRRVLLQRLHLPPAPEAQGPLAGHDRPRDGHRGRRRSGPLEAHIAEARARQASSTEDHCVFVERSPELEPYHYMRAIDRMFGSTRDVFQVTKMNGHFLVGMASRGMAERLVNEGLEVEGTLHRAFPFRKKAERITVGNLPFFVGDAAVISALSPFGRVTSIAPKLMKAGPYVYNDGRREAFIILREGMTIERLPTRLDIPIKGEAWPAYLSSGIRCSRCRGQGHRRANCPLLAGRTTEPGPATPTSPTSVPPATAPKLPQQPSAKPPPPASPSPAMEVSDVPPASRAALLPPAALRSSPPAPLASPAETPPPPPPVTPASPLRAPGGSVSPQSAKSQPSAKDIEMTTIEESSASSTASSRKSTREVLVTLIRKSPAVSFAETDALGLGREEILDLLSSKTRAQRQGPLLTPPQNEALAGMIKRLLGLKPGSNTSVYKVLRQVKSVLRTGPAAVPPTPTLTAPRPAKPTPPVPQRKESAPTRAASLLAMPIKTDEDRVKMPKGVSNMILAESPERAAHEPERLSSKYQTSAEISAKIGFQKNSSGENQDNSNLANLPAGKEYANPAAARDVTAPPTAALNSATTASPASLNWADSEMVEVDDNEGFTVVKSKKRRRTSTTPEHAAKQPSRPAEKPSSQQRKRPTGPRAVPPKEIKATRANIAEAKARQTSSTHENYIFVELCPDIPDYSYLRAMGKLVGGPGGITQFNRMNGHYIVGLATKDLARRLVEGGLEIDGTTLRVFPYRKRAERVVVANLPGFVEDKAVEDALRPYGNTTSIAPILVKMGEYTFTDGRREAFVLLHDGINLEKLPTRLNVRSKGDNLPAYLSFGIKCSKCGKQGHRRANCPALARQGSSSPRQAASPTDAGPLPPPPPQQPRRLTPAPATPASPVQPAKTPTEAPAIPSAPHPAEPKDLSQHAPVALPAPMAAPRPLEPAILPLDIEMSEEEWTSTPSTPSKGIPAIIQLREHLEKLPSIAINHSGLLGLDWEDAQKLLASSTNMKKRVPSLLETQVTAFTELAKISWTHALTRAPLFTRPSRRPGRQHHVDIAFVQETNAFHLGSGQDLCLGYNAVVLAHPVAISGSGLACVFGPGVAVIQPRVLWPGHIALATIDVHGEEMTAIVVHLAHEPRERNRQLELLAATAAQEEEGACWIIGDFNIRDRGPSSSSSSDALAALLDLAALVDVATQFDAAHLPTRVAMHGDQVESNRLDRILVTAGILDRVSIYATSHYHLSDHRLVLLQVGAPTTAVSSPTKPRLAAMLRSGLALEHLAGYIRELEEDAAHDDDDGTFWDRWTSIKAGLLAEARSLHDPRHAASDSYVYRARRYIAAQLEASSIRADYPSLPDLARAIRLRRPVSVIRDDEDNVIEGPELRRRAFATFRPRFARPTTDPAAGAAFIASSAPTTTRELSEEDPLHRPDISPSEIANAIEHLPRGKAPGWDGLPCELLVAFNEDFFAEALARVFAASRLRGALPPSTRRSSICLVHKARGGRGLDGYRPVALPSADYRVLAAILHRRLKPHLRTLVPECQTYAVPGRSPSWNIAKVTDAVEEATAMGSPLAVMGIDLESAFESLDRGFLESLMTSLRLPPAFIGWISILYAGADATIRAGGFHTTAFPLLNGLRQGCAEQHLLALLESACRKWTPFTRGLSLVGRARAANSLVGSTIQHHLHGYLPSPPTIAKLQARLARFVWGPEHTAWLPAAVMARPVAIGGLGLLDLATQLQIACLKGVQVALRGGRNGFDWLVASDGEAWIRPPPDGTRLQPRRLRLLKLWEEASKILSLNHRAVPTAQLLDLPIIGGCRFLRPPVLPAPASWRGARVRDLIVEDHLIARPTRSALADAAALGAFCRRLTSQNAVGFGAESAPSSSSLAAAVVLRGTATPFLNGLTTRSARRALDRPRLAATPISRFTSRWSPTIGPPPSRIDWASLRRCAHSGHEADAALKLALHALPHPAHPASVGPSCPACGSIDRSLGHRYWCCRSIRPLIREAFNIIGRPPDLQAWIFGGSGLEDDALSILASAKLRIYRYFVQGDSELAEMEDNDAFTVVGTKKRRRDLPVLPAMAAQSNSAGTSRRQRSSTGWIPPVQEIRTTTAHVMEARARQASCTEEQCLYLEYCPDYQSYQYLRAIERVVGGHKNIFQFSKINGHYLLGLASKSLAEHLVREGLEIEGILIRTFPFSKSSTRITVGNLPFFVADAAIIDALSRYGRITSIAPKLLKAGEFTYTDGRREAFILLHDGITIDKLPTRFEIRIKGEAWPAFLSHGIKCSKCHGQGHRRANCPQLHGRSATARRASPPPSTDLPPSTAPGLPRQSSAAPPSPSNKASRAPSDSCAASLPSAAPWPSTPAPPASPMQAVTPAPPPMTPSPEDPMGPRSAASRPESTPPARPDFIAPCGPLPAQGTLGPATHTPDVDMTTTEEPSAPSPAAVSTPLLPAPRPAGPTPSAPHKEDPTPAMTPPSTPPTPMEEDLPPNLGDCIDEILGEIIMSKIDPGPLVDDEISWTDAIDAILHPHSRAPFLARLSPILKKNYAVFFEAAIERARDSHPWILSGLSELRRALAPKTRQEPSRSAEQVPERPSTGSQPGEELSPKKGIIENSSLEFSMEYRTHASPPAREAHGTLAAARGDVTAPPTAASSSENLADPASLNWADSEMAEVDANDDYTVVKSKKRRLSSTPEQAAKQASRPAEKRGPQQQKRTTGPRSMPPQEIKATRANIADARARQANTNHENYVFVELCPDIPDYSYLRAIGDLVGGPKNIAHFGRMNGHYIVGLASKNLASRLVEEGLNIEGTLLKVFPFRKRAERIIVANLPGFVEDATIVQALREYGDITSIAPIMIKMGEFAFSDGRREAFILLREGVRLETLPTRLTIHSKGDTLSAFLSFGIKCSKCGKQGHRRANCPALARQGNGSPRQAASPTDARPPPPSSSATKEAGTCARNTGETNAFHPGSGQDLCLGYSAVVLAHPVAISGSGLACVFGPGVAVLQQRILWPGHIALATIDVHGEEMTAIAVHLAHEPRERNRQLELLAATAAQEEEGACWIIGDFNIRDRGPSSSSSSSDALAALLDLAALVDVATQFDAAHLPTRVSMHGDQVESNRLDRILVPAGVLDRVSIYATSHYHLSDHRLVLLQVGPPTTAVSSPTQPRLAAMLRSGLALEHLAGYIRKLEEDTAHDDDDGTFWDRWTSIKAGLLAEARSLHDPRHAANDSYVYRARRYIAAQLEASSIRADYPSLPDLARAIRLRRPVSVIRDEQDNIIEGPELRRRAFATFQPRFARPTSDPAAGAAFIASSAPTTTRELSEEDPLHRPDISPSEIANAIEHLPRGKAPGWDGLPCEDFFAEALARVFAASRLRGALPPSTRRSSICLVPKARGGRGLDGYRPVALPSADYRVLAAILHRRLKPHLRTLVPECQTYAVPGRSPSWNIAMVTDAIEEATALGSPLAVMGVDLESAFDSLDRGFLESLLTSLRLPPAFMAWINILYAGADATIRVGGFHTTAFPLLNGLRQGCAVSAALFSIATGPLLRRLELTLGVGNVIAYADDIVLLFHRDGDFERVASVFEDYRQASGIGVNLGKSAGLWCGAWRNRGDSPLGASWSTTSIRVLGLDIAPRSTVIHREQHLLALLETACRKWTPFTRGLSLVGRARAANTLVGSVIQHHLHGYLPSPPTIAKLQARLARFVWGQDHTAWLPADVMARPVAIGGLGLLDLATQLQLAYLKGVQVALRGGRNAFSWLVGGNSGEAWIHPPPDGTRLQPRRLRLLKLWEEASNILGLNHRAVPTAQLLDLPIIGGCRFLRPPDLLAPARWRGARVRDLIVEENLIARPTRSALADAATLGAFCRRLTSENAVGFGAESTPSSSSLAAAVVLRGTATPFLNGLTTRSARRALDRPRLAATPISRFLARWTPTINPPSRIDWASLRRCAYSGHEADAALKLALHALPHPAHPASVGPSCPACGSIDRSLSHRYWCCPSIRPLIREALNIIGRPPDLQAWIFGGSGLEDDALSILASAKLRIYRCFVQVGLGEAISDIPPGDLSRELRKPKRDLVEVIKCIFIPSVEDEEYIARASQFQARGRDYLPLSLAVPVRESHITHPLPRLPSTFHIGFTTDPVEVDRMTEDGNLQRMTEAEDEYFADALTNMQPHCDELVSRLTDAIRGLAMPRAEEALIPPFDGSYAANNFIQQLERTSEGPQDDATLQARLRTLLKGEPLSLYNELNLASLPYSQAKQTLIDLYSGKSEVTFTKFLTFKLNNQIQLGEYYRQKIAMGLQLGLTNPIIVEALTEGLQANDQRLMRAIAPKTLTEWYTTMNRIKGTNSLPTSSEQFQGVTNTSAFHRNTGTPSRGRNYNHFSTDSTPRYPSSARKPPSPCKYCQGDHWNNECSMNRRPYRQQAYHNQPTAHYFPPEQNGAHNLPVPAPRSSRTPQGRLFRWSLKMSAYEYDIKYIKGKTQYEADLLSRNPLCGFLTTTQIIEKQPQLPPSTLIKTNIDCLHTIKRKGIVKIIVPPSLQHTLIKRVHFEYNHPGVSQMIRLISTQYTWCGMTKSIVKYNRSCPTCQLIKKPKGPLYGRLERPPIALQPYDMLSIDTISGFSKYGNSKSYLHVIVDHLSRYTWTFPSKSTNIITYIQCLKKVLQCGRPKRLLSDRAPAFTSPKFRRFLIKNGIQPLLTTANNPQANGLCERLNATLTGKLRLLNLENPGTSWTKLIKIVTNKYNDTPHTITGFPPVFLMYNIIPSDLNNHLNPYPNIIESRKLAIQRTNDRHDKEKLKYDNKHKNPHFGTGDLVLVKAYHHPNSGKLVPYFTGPYKITEMISDNVVRINRPNRITGNDSDTVHVNKLQYYNEEVLYISPPKLEPLKINRIIDPFRHLDPNLFSPIEK